MCTFAGELRFCSCNFGDHFPENYWVLHRFNSDKDLLVIGEVICEFVDPIIEATISAFILASLNNAVRFDTGVSIEVNDVLEINLNHNDQKYNYRYKFTRSKWREFKKLSSFELLSRYDEIQYGLTEPEISSLLKQILITKNKNV